MKKIIMSFAILLLVLCGVLFFRANTFFNDNQFDVKTPLEPVQIEKQAVLEPFQMQSKFQQFPMTTVLRLTQMRLLPFSSI